MAAIEKELGQTATAVSERLYQKYTDGALHVTFDGVGVPAALAPWTLTEVDLATNADVTVTATPAIIGNIWVSVVMSDHAAYIKDGASSILTLPAQSAAGTEFTTLFNSSFATSIVVNSDDLATGKIMVQWKDA